MFLIGYTKGDYHGIHTKLLALSPNGMLVIAFSCVVGTLIGYSGWLCRGKISATSFTLVGVVNKFLTVLLNVMVCACACVCVCVSIDQTESADANPTQDGADNVLLLRLTLTYLNCIHCLHVCLLPTRCGRSTRPPQASLPSVCASSPALSTNRWVVIQSAPLL